MNAAAVSGRPSHFPTLADAQEFLAANNGGEPFDYFRDNPETLRVAEHLGVAEPVRAAIAMSHELDDVIDASVERAKRAAPRPAPRVMTYSGERNRVLTWPQPLDLEALAERAPLVPKFIIPDWLPAGYATGLWGHGGGGKSQVALYMGVCGASGRDFFGLPVARCRVLFLSCEDRADVLHWRLSRICAHRGIDLASLRGWLHVVDLVGNDCVLWAHDRGAGSLTAAYGELDARMRDTDLLVVDGITDTYAGSELDRAEIKRYVNSLLALIASDGAVLLVGHVDKATAKNSATAEGYSGSTSWHNSVRSRWFLYPEGQDVDNAAVARRTGSIVLDLQKSNHGRAGHSIRLTWDENAHLFLPDAAEIGGDGIVGHLQGARAERIVLDAARRLAALGLQFTDGSTSPRFLPRLILEYKLGQGATKSQLAAAMREAMLAGTITREQIGKYSNRAPMFGLRVSG